MARSEISKLRVKKSKNKLAATRTPENAQINFDHPFSASSIAKIIAKLRTKLDHHAAQIKTSPSGAEWTRYDIIKILESISDFVDSISTDKILSQDDELIVLAEHPAVTILNHFIAALKDLNNGNVDKRLKSPAGFGGAAHKAAEASDITLWLNTVEIVRQHEDITYAKAEGKVASVLSKAKVKHRGRYVTAEKLRRWRKTPKGKRA